MEILSRGYKVLCQIPDMLHISIEDEEMAHPIHSLGPFPTNHPFDADPLIELAEAKVHNGQHCYTVRMDARSFSPEDLVVKTANGFLIIEGRREEKSDPSGQIATTRQFKRMFALPETCNVGGLMCEVGAGGTLMVKIPHVHKGDAKEARIHQIADERKGDVHYFHPRCTSVLPHYWIPGVTKNEDSFVVTLKVPQFGVDEITVKTIGRYLDVEGTHEKEEDGHGFVSRAFKRTYLLPENADKDGINCELGIDGELLVTVPLVKPEKSGVEKIYEVVRKWSMT